MTRSLEKRCRQIYKMLRKKKQLALSALPNLGLLLGYPWLVRQMIYDIVAGETSLTFRQSERLCPPTSMSNEPWGESFFFVIKLSFLDNLGFETSLSLDVSSTWDKHRHAMHARVISLCGWINWNVVSDFYIFTKEKSINAEKNEDVELTHTQVFCGRLFVLCE